MRSELLDDLRYEDDQGLWEVVWTLNTRCPEVDLASKIALARTVVFSLFEDGLVELRQGGWPHNEGAALTEREIARLRHDDTPWNGPLETDLLVHLTAVDDA